MKIDWSPLEAELALWRRAAVPLPLWWRDDDAVAATPALNRLADMAAEVGMPVHVAVIPALVEPSLAPLITSRATLVPIVHGWRHISHAPEGAKNAEFGHPRIAAQSELSEGLARLTEVFRDDLVPLFVPPWNRIHDSMLPALQSAGYGGVSTYGPRASARTAQNLAQINTHIDPIYWRGHRGLVDPDTLIENIRDTLRQRRVGETDTTEPLGLLTHHLVHTEAVWTFTRDVLVVLLNGGAVPADIAALVQGGPRPDTFGQV